MFNRIPESEVVYLMEWINKEGLNMQTYLYLYNWNDLSYSNKIQNHDISLFIFLPVALGLRDSVY